MLHRAAVSRQLGRPPCAFRNHVYANFNLTVVDDTHIYVGDHTMIGPKDREVYFRDRKIPPELAED